MIVGADVDEGWGTGGGFDVEVDVAAGFVRLEDVEGHVDDVVEVALGLVPEAYFDGAGASTFGVEADADEGEILSDVLWAGLRIEDFNGDGAADVVAAELVEIREPLVFGNSLCLHDEPHENEIDEAGRLGRPREIGPQRLCQRGSQNFRFCGFEI
jgi:hypothetical protein